MAVTDMTPQWEAMEQTIDLRDILRRLWVKRWWIVISASLATAIAALIAFTTPPVYRSKVVMIQANSDRHGLGAGLGSALGQLGGLASIAGVNLTDANSEKEEALAVLGSRQFTEAFISEMHLMPELYPKQWDATKNTWRADVDKLPTPAKAYRLFNTQIRRIIQDKKTGLITLQIDWTDRQKAALWANELVDRLNAEMRARAIAMTNASIGYLESELKNTADVSTREAINRLIEAQIKQRMLANVTQEFSFRVIDKAMASDADDKIKPKKLITILVGCVIGTAMSVAAVLLFVPSGRKVVRRFEE